MAFFIAIHFPNGREEVTDVHTVPRIGETVIWRPNTDSTTRWTVTDVTHSLTPVVTGPVQRGRVDVYLHEKEGTA
jgi:hypothetical protein